jgi:N-glycosylase/DNA lyase
MVSEHSQITQKVNDYDLAATLNSGQAFCWELAGPGEWRGWVDGKPIRVQRGSDCFRFRGRGMEIAKLSRYFQWSEDLSAIQRTFPDDEWMREAVAYSPGLRILRQDPWETVANFISSAMKQVSQIQQINRALRQRFGREMEPGCWSFPHWRVLAQSTEEMLRECKLGFRAKHLIVTARQLTEGEVSLEKIETMPTDQAREELIKLRGVGRKVANCILLFAYGRMDVVPVDVWIERAIRTLYFPKKRKVTDKRIREFASTYFGPNGGYAQQYLFHWLRTREKVAAVTRE